MPSNSKSYVDSDGLSRFLTNLKAAYTNGAQGFTVKNATYATYAAGESTPISTTYLKSSVAESTYTPLTRSFGGLTLEADRSKSDVLTALNVADGAQVNVIETIKVRPSKGAAAGTNDITLVPSSKTVIVDLSDYAKLTDISAVMNFMGVVDYASQLPDAASPTAGDVWIVRYRGSSGTEAANAEYVWTGTAWEEFGTTTILDGYATETWVGQNYVAKSVYENDISSINSAIENIYKAGTPAQGDPEDPDYVPAVPESGVLVDKVNAEKTRAMGVESGLQGAIDTLNGNDSTTGSVAKSIKDAIGALDYASNDMPAGDFVTGVTETNGVIAVTRAAYSSMATADQTGLGGTPATAADVKQYVDGLVGGGLDALDLADVGAVGGYVQVVGQSNGKLSATAGTFDTTIGPASGTGAATNNTAPTSLAVRTLVDSVTVKDQNSAIIDQMVPVSNAAIDALFPTTPSQGS